MLMPPNDQNWATPESLPTAARCQAARYAVLCTQLTRTGSGFKPRLVMIFRLAHDKPSGILAENLKAYA